MRRLLIVTLVGLVIGAALINLVEQDPGYVFISLGDVTIETSFWFATVLWLVVWALLSASLAALRTLLRGRQWISDWVVGRKARNAGALTNRGLISFIEGHWARARRQLLRAARYSDAPLVNHLLAAQASYRLGDVDEMRRQLGLAETVEAGVGIALELTQAELQLTAGHNEEALATLVRARANASKHPHVLELLARVHRKLADWPALRDLLPELRRRDLLDSPHLQGLEAELWFALLDTACSSELDANELQNVWQTIPLSWREKDSLRCRYIEALVARGMTAEQEKLLIAMVTKQWNKQLVRVIGSYPPADPKRLMKALHRWLESHGQEVVLLVAAARLAQHMGDWQQARSWFEEANKIEPKADTCMELARLASAQGDRAAADAYLRLAGSRLLDGLSLAPIPDKADSPSS